MTRIGVFPDRLIKPLTDHCSGSSELSGRNAAEFRQLGRSLFPGELMMIQATYIDVLKRICRLLSDLDHPWAITGSMGMALQGVDIDVHDIVFKLIAQVHI